MQISYEKCRSGPSGAPAAVPPKLCRGESLPLLARGAGSRARLCERVHEVRERVLPFPQRVRCNAQRQCSGKGKVVAIVTKIERNRVFMPRGGAPRKHR